MLDDLENHQHLIGRSKTEVLSLLGQPEDVTYFPGFDLTYRLGSTGGFGFDEYWLGIKLDKQGRVTHFETLVLPD